LAHFLGSSDDVDHHIGQVLAGYTLGRHAASRQALQELVDKHAGDAAYQIAEGYAWSGEADQSFAWLERAYQQRDSGLYSLRIDPLLANLRGDPRYAAMLRKLKLND
jgi:adenylate cyclase